MLVFGAHSRSLIVFIILSFSSITTKVRILNENVHILMIVKRELLQELFMRKYDDQVYSSSHILRKACRKCVHVNSKARRITVGYNFSAENGLMWDCS